MKINELRPWIDSIISIASSPATSITDPIKQSEDLHLNVSQSNSFLILDINSKRGLEETLDITIFNLLGQVVYKERAFLTNGRCQTTIGKRGLSSSVGIIVIRNRNGNKLTKKIFLGHN